MLYSRPLFLCRSCNGLLTKHWQARSQPGSTPFVADSSRSRSKRARYKLQPIEEACSTPDSQGGLRNQRVQFYIAKLASVCIVPIYTLISNVWSAMFPWQLSNRIFGECLGSLTHGYLLSDRNTVFLRVYFPNYKSYLNIFLLFLSFSVHFMLRFLWVFFLFLFIFLLFLVSVYILKIKAFYDTDGSDSPNFTFCNILIHFCRTDIITIMTPSFLSWT